MEPIAKLSLTGLAMIYLIAAVHMVTVIQNPLRAAGTAQPTISADANLPEMYARAERE